MANFRRWSITSALLLLTAGLATAQVGIAGGGNAGRLVCSARNASIPQLRAEGYTELLGDVIIECTGGPTYSTGTQIPTTNITVYLSPSTNAITSRLLDIGSEALLLIDEPGSPLPTGASGGFGPQAPQIFCATRTGCPSFIGLDGTGNYEVATATQPTGPGFLATSDFNNVYQGYLNAVGVNTVTFYGVPVLPPVTTGVSRVFRITNLRFPTVGLANGQQILASVSTSPSMVLPIDPTNFPIGTVISPGLASHIDPAPTGGQGTFSQCVAPTGPMLSAKLHFIKGFATAFKTRSVPQSDTPWASTMPNAGQNLPGGLYDGFASNNESGFVFTPLTVNSAVAGLADYGTRLKAVFTNIPPGVVLYVSTASGAPPAVPGGTAKVPYAVLVTTDQSREADSDGAGLTPLTSVVTGSDGLPAYLLPISNGSAAAIWEVVNANPNAVDELAFSVYVSYTPGAPTLAFPGGTPMTGVLNQPLNDVSLSFAPDPDGGTFTAANGPLPQAAIIPRYQIINPSHGPWVTIADCPETVTQLAPAAVAAGTGDFTLTINGTNFVPSDLVIWNASNAVQLATTYVSPAQLQALVPASFVAVAGTASVQVQSVLSTSNAATFTIVPIPVITTVAPASLNAGGAARDLTVTGSGFMNGAVVSWSGTALATTFVNATSLTATLPAARTAISGSFALLVTNPGSVPAVTAYPFVVNPIVTTVAPSTVPSGSPDVTITATGVGFAATDSLVLIATSSTPLTTTYVNSTSLTAVVPAATLLTAGSDKIAVADATAGTASAQLAFTIALPQVTQLSPNAATMGSAAFTLTVTGTMFAPSAVVRWGATALATTYVSATQLTAGVPATLLATSGTVNVTVANPGSNASTATSFLVASAVITSLGAPSVTAAGPAFILTVNGTGFDSSATVQWNNSLLPTTFVSSTKLTASVAAFAIASPGSATITVLSQGVVSNGMQLTIMAGSVLSNLSPQSANAGDAAFTLTVNGNNFFAGCTVTWNGIPLQTTYLGTTQLTASVGANLIGSAGHILVGISYPGGGTSNSLQFTVIGSAPTISSLTPASATAGGPAFTLTVAGAGFDSAVSVHWNGIALTTAFTNSTQVSASVPASFIASPGTASVNVVTSSGIGSNMIPITIRSGPAISSLSPWTVPAGGPDFTLVVNGSNFVSGATINWNNAPLATTFVNATQLNATVSASRIATAGSIGITVMNPDRTASVLVYLQVGTQVPAITSLSPASVTVGSAGITVTINGSGFLSTSTVTGFAGATTFISSTQMVVSVSASQLAAVGSLHISVTNPGATSNTLDFNVTAALPDVTGFAPSTAVAGSPGFTLTINGANFDSAATVAWNTQSLPTTFINSGRLTATVPANLIANTGSAWVAVVNPGGLTSAMISFAITPPPPTTATAAIVNAASSLPAIAPGTLISIYGANLANDTGRALTYPLPYTLAGTSVTISNIPAPLLFVGPGQINAQVPFEIKAGTAKLVIESQGMQSAPIDIQVTATGPGVFIQPGTTQAVAVNVADNSLNTPKNPVKPGQYITAYMVGQGMLDNPVATGTAAPSSPYSCPLANVSITLGGMPVDIQFAGMAPGYAGLMQLNLLIPALSAGNQTLIVSIGGVTANSTIVSIGQ